MARADKLRGRTTQYMRKVYKHRIDQGEVLPCGICGLPCFARARGNNRISKGGLGAVTVDHIMPLGRGGLDVVSNMQPAHLKCNTDKGDSL